MVTTRYKDYVQQMKTCQKMTDTKHAHVMADEVVLQFLKNSGYIGLAHEYAKVRKWYS